MSMDIMMHTISAKNKKHSTYPPHIRKLLDYANITCREYDEDGRVIAVKGFLNTNQIRLFKPRL